MSPNDADVCDKLISKGILLFWGVQEKVRFFIWAVTEENVPEKGTIYILKPKSPKGTIIRHGTIISLLLVTGYSKGGKALVQQVPHYNPIPCYPFWILLGESGKSTQVQSPFDVFAPRKCLSCWWRVCNEIMVNKSSLFFEAQSASFRFGSSWRSMLSGEKFLAHLARDSPLARLLAHAALHTSCGYNRGRLALALQMKLFSRSGKPDEAQHQACSSYQNWKLRLCVLGRETPHHLSDFRFDPSARRESSLLNIKMLSISIKWEIVCIDMECLLAPLLPYTFASPLRYRLYPTL